MSRTFWQVVLLCGLVVLALTLVAFAGLKAYLTAISAVCLSTVFFYLIRGFVWNVWDYSKVALAAGLIGFIALLLRGRPVFDHLCGVSSDFFLQLPGSLHWSAPVFGGLSYGFVGVAGSLILAALGMGRNVGLRRILAAVLLWWTALALIAASIVG